MTEEEKRKYQPPPTLGNKPKPRENRELKKRILKTKIKQIGSIDTNFTGEETMNWLIKMEDETIVPGAMLLDGSRFSMPILMDLIFDNLERYSFEINKRNSFNLHCERPSGYKEKIDHFHRRKVRYIRAHLSSDKFSMIFNAIDDSIDVYIIPTDFLVGFDPYDSEFQPYVTLDKLSVQESSSWGIERTKLSEEDYAKLCRRLIGKLIKVIEANALPDDKFSLSASSDEDDSEDVFTDRSFEATEEEDPGLHAGEQLPSAMQPAYLAKQSETEVKAQSNPLETEAETPLVDNRAKPNTFPKSSVQSKNTTTFPKPDTTASQSKPAVVPKQKPPLAPQITKKSMKPPVMPKASVPGSEEEPLDNARERAIEKSTYVNTTNNPTPEADSGDIKHQVDEAQRTVVEALTVVVSGIDDALESMHQTGVQAMKGYDLQKVTDVMNESKRLQSVKDKLSQVLKDISDV